MISQSSEQKEKRTKRKKTISKACMRQSARTYFWGHLDFFFFFLNYILFHFGPCIVVSVFYMNEKKHIFFPSMIVRFAHHLCISCLITQPMCLLETREHDFFLSHTQFTMLCISLYNLIYVKIVCLQHGNRKFVVSINRFLLLLLMLFRSTA